MNATLHCITQRSSSAALYALCRASRRARHLATSQLAAAADGAACRPPLARISRHKRSLACRATGGESKPAIILGIESSCDDTGVAVVSSDGRILGEALATQADIHAPWGGVVPKLAQEAHEAAMDKTVAAALQAAGLSAAQLDAVAVTIGPGLSLCLKVGVLKARELAASAGLPLVPVHHMEAHALVARLFHHSRSAQQQPGAGAASGPEAGAAGGTAADDTRGGGDGGDSLAFPFVCLLVSGGHNQLLLAHGVGRYTQLGATLDDALGEAYDKVARLLGIAAIPSGGAALEALAAQGDPMRFRFPIPMKKYANANFSYAGLKTAVRLAVEAEVGPDPEAAPLQVRADIAASFQRVAVAHLAQRTARACGWAREAAPGTRALVVAGGVAANATVRRELQRVAAEAGLELVMPPPRYCTDNGVMVAWAGAERFKLGLYEPPPSTAAPGEDELIDLRPRWPLTDDIDARSAPQKRSARKVRIHTSLTALTHQAATAAATQAATQAATEAATQAATQAAAGPS